MIFFVRFKHNNSFFSIFFFLLSACTPKPHSQGSRVGEDPGNKIACTPAGYYSKWNRFLNIAYCSFSSRTECTWLLILWSVTTLYIEQLMDEIPEYTTVWFLCSSLLCNSKQNILSGEKLQAENYSLYLHPPLTLLPFCPEMHPGTTWFVLYCWKLYLFPVLGGEA